MDTNRHSESAASTSSSKRWSSKINVCPGSTPTLVMGAASGYNLPEEEEEGVVEEELELFSNVSSEVDTLIDWGSDSTWPDLLDVSGTWGTYVLDEHPWDDSNKPCVKMRQYKDLILDEKENRGILTDRIIAACSSYLDRSPVTRKYVLCKVELSKKLLSDISILAYHHYLQYLNLSWNELSDVQVLGQLPFLMYLDVSHNFLTEVLNFKPPFNLTFVNYSNNAIKRIGDLRKFWSIVHLDLSHNRIKVIEGLQQLKYLRHLNLSYNSIECIENLNNIKLLTLNLQRNGISKFEEGNTVGFRTLIDVLRINVAFNQLNTLRLFEGIPGIQAINAMGNAVDDLMEITHLQDLNFLTEVDFRDNPIVNMKNYAEVCLSTIKYLYLLDGEIMNAEKKVMAKHSFNPPPSAEAIRTSSKILFLQQINDPVLGQPVISCDHPPPPIIILVGPPGSGKASLLQKFCKHNKRFTILGVSHTTREKTNEEVEDEFYYFINTTQFRDMAYKGEFLTVSRTLGHLFGLAQTEMAKTVGKAAVLMLHMDLNGALALRAKGFNCRLVLAMTSTTECHRKQLLEKYYSQQDNSRYVGAMEVENCPTKAKQFIEENQPRSSITSVANDIVNEILHTPKSRDDMFDMREIESMQSFRADDASCDSERAIMSSSRTSGILKSPSKQRGLEAHQPRLSVMFQEIDEPIYTYFSQSQARVQQSRSVTFSVAPHLGEDVDTTQYSVSGTLIPDRDEHGLLSVLSRADVEQRRDSGEENQKLWTFQTNALKAVVDDILTSRATYLHTHHTNPGLFVDVVFTDKPDDAMKKLKALLKQCVVLQGNTKPYCEYQKDSVYKVMVASRLKSLHKDIESQLSITNAQMQSMAQQTPSKPLELIPKIPQTDVIKKMSREHKAASNYKLPPEANLLKKKSICESTISLQQQALNSMSHFEWEH